MCLEFDPVDQKRLLAEIFGKKQYIICYKEVQFYNEEDIIEEQHYGGDILSYPHMQSPVFNTVIKTRKGFYVSDRPDKKITLYERGTFGVHKGIHVYSSQANPPYDAIKVKCYKRHFVAANYDSSEIVFTRVELQKSDIKKWNTEESAWARANRKAKAKSKSKQI